MKVSYNGFHGNSDSTVVIVTPNQPYLINATGVWIDGVIQW